MKNIVISARRIKLEFAIFIACLVAALGVNVYAILRFGTRWIELLTTFHITLVIALIFFAVVALLRLLICGGRRIFSQKAS